MKVNLQHEHPTQFPRGIIIASNKKQAFQYIDTWKRKQLVLLGTESWTRSELPSSEWWKPFHPQMKHPIWKYNNNYEQLVKKDFNVFYVIKHLQYINENPAVKNRVFLSHWRMVLVRTKGIFLLSSSFQKWRSGTEKLSTRFIGE